MEFGIYIGLTPREAAEQAKLAEELGFSTAWFGDLPLACADTYVCMASAALATRRIKLGTAIAVAPMRSAPVTAHSIATINALAPGRVILGFGTGSFGRALAGLPPMKMRAFRHQVQTIHGLLRTGEASWETEGVRRKIRFFNRDLRATNLEDRIPLYIGASAPRAASLAGEFGDGLITGGLPTAEFFRAILENVRAGASRVGRVLGETFPCVVESYLCILQPRETPESPRVIDRLGPAVLMWLRMLASGGIPVEIMPAAVRTAVARWTEHLGVDHFAPEERHLALFEGVFRMRADERQFVTRDAVEALGLVGHREEVVEKIKGLEEAGVTQLIVSPPEGGFAEVAREMAEQLIGRV